ncbi:hypothetical protein [Limnobaculum xujianqingii]|uniref:hypothetical protein n=1 Tax=Limnobaculum xujianqingii TaxID=2738837 RepID=UPI0011280916|nr:hypothetical protein [Limnobaculum xujianqingii]
MKLTISQISKSNKPLNNPKVIFVRANSPDSPNLIYLIAMTNCNPSVEDTLELPDEFELERPTKKKAKLNGIPVRLTTVVETGNESKIIGAEILHLEL